MGIVLCSLEVVFEHVLKGEKSMLECCSEEGLFHCRGCFLDKGVNLRFEP